MGYPIAYRFDSTHNVRRTWRNERTGIESDAATVDYATAQNFDLQRAQNKRLSLIPSCNTWQC